MNPPTHWQPATIAELRADLGAADWVLCGGHALDVFLGRATREHADIDVGLLRRDAVRVLARLDRRRVFLCSAGCHLAWDGAEIPAAVHDLWITSADFSRWSFQVMLYDTEGEDVIYRRDPRLRWPLAEHALARDGIRILNPAITLLYKLQSAEVRDKDRADWLSMLRHFARESRPTRG